MGLATGPVLALILGSGPLWGFTLDASLPPADQQQLSVMAAVTVLMAVWWLTEAAPMAVTALLPLVYFPTLGIMPAKDAAAEYGDPVILLFLGGFLIALAVEESGLHRRVALWIVSVMGGQPRRVVFGFMLATAALSMWISNTATVMLMLPIAVSVLAQAGSQNGDPRQQRNFGVALLLGIAYAASIGGMSTLIGTPPNVAFKAIYSSAFPVPDATAPEISFFRWMFMAMPFSLLFLVVAWCLLTRLLFRLPNASFLGSRNVIGEQLRALGPITRAEFRTAVVFVITGTLWVFREPLPGFGWSPWMQYREGYVNDGTVAMLMAALCFIIPSGTKPNRALLEWQSVKRVPWGLLILFGGGLALARGMEHTGLDEYLGRRLAAALQSLPDPGKMAVTALGVTSLTELTSNTASVNMISPVLARTAQQLHVPPLMLMLPATLAASCAFMLPIATPPNAIVYGSGRMRVHDMVKAGLWLNLAGVVLVVLAVAVFGVWAFGKAAIFGVP
jgi:sodium-dependent dicarboxylate transporter 2/3/5